MEELSPPQTVLGQLDIHVLKNEAGPRPHTAHKDQLQMEHRLRQADNSPPAGPALPLRPRGRVALHGKG